MQGGDQEPRHDHERGLPTDATTGPDPDERRDREHPATGHEPVPARQAVVLPGRDGDLSTERDQRACPHASAELDEDRRERRKSPSQPRPDDARLTAGQAHLVQGALSEPTEPAMQGARMQRAQATGHRPPQPHATLQVSPDRPLHDPEAIQLPRRQVRREDPRAMPAGHAHGLAHDTPGHSAVAGQVLEEERHARDPTGRETEPTDLAAARTRDVDQ
jgi:hypothetical protein